MRLATALAMVVAIAVAAPAQGLAPAPTVRDFDDQPAGTDISMVYAGSGVGFLPGAYNDCTAGIVAAGGNVGAQFLHAGCPSFIRITFTDPQGSVRFFYKVGTSFGAPSTLDASAFDDAGSASVLVDQRTVAPTPDRWVALTLADPDDHPSINRVEVSTSHYDFGIDDLAYSPSAQPDTEITSGPPAQTVSTAASFTFQANQPSADFSCTLDAQPLATCPAPSLDGVALGDHTFTVAATDRWGITDATPATYSWTVVTGSDHDGDTVPDALDNCPAKPNPSEVDTDADGLGDRCDPLPPGNLPPIAGRRTVAAQVSGKVFVKLQRGFVPLKGVASLPVGAIVDARKGRLRLTSAGDSKPAGDPRRRLKAALFAAGIFRIRQAPPKGAGNRRVATDAVLMSTAEAERVCARRQGGRAPKATVRRLSVTAKGLHRTVGGASVTSARQGTWIVSDRCNGTLTKVRRGRVKVRDEARHRTVTVRAGRSYLARERLFRVRKGHPLGR